MQEYYILNEGKRTGPYTIYELKERKIYPETQVWSEEQQDWYNAEDFPELRHIITFIEKGHEYNPENMRDERFEKSDEKTSQEKIPTEPPPTSQGEKVYYIYRKGQTIGPYNVYQLKELGIYFDTDIWSYEQNRWIRAENFPELRYIIAEPPVGYRSESISTYNTYFGYSLAGIGERFIAELITGIVSALIAGVFSIPYYVYIYSLSNSSGDSPGSFLIVALFLLGLMLIGVAAAFAFRCLLYPRYCGTLGHKVMGIKVISAEDGNDYNKMTQGLIREALKSILGQFIIPVIWLFWDKDKQNLYDKVVKTYVVKRNDYL